MRALILLAGASLALSGCSGDEAANTAVAADENLSAETISANDMTAIDAATSEDANMAADVVLTANDLIDANLDNGANATATNIANEAE